MKIFKGIIKRVPKEEHFEAYKSGILQMNDVKLIDTIITCQGQKSEFNMLPLRLSYQEIDKMGNEKYTFDSEKQEYFKAYKQTPILYATGKEMRIILELGEFAPVKVVTREEEKDGHTFHVIECVQNQSCGLE